MVKVLAGRRRVALWGCATILGAVIVTGVASGAFEGTDGIIKACVANKGGQVRVIDQSAVCTRREEEILLANGTSFYNKSDSDARYVAASALADAELEIAIISEQVTGLSARVAALEDNSAPLAAPTSVEASAGIGQITVTWSATNGASSYDVYRSTSVVGPYSRVGSSVTTQYIDSEVVNGVTYYYVVRAVYTSGQSGDSGAASATVAAVNSAPIIANVESSPLVYVVGAPAEFITASATVADADSPDFSGGVLAVSLSGGDGGDQLSVGTDGGISVAGSSIKVGPTTVGSFSYDSENMILSVYFSSTVDASVVQAVTRCVTYAHPSDLQTGTPRTAEFVVTDGDGGTSEPAWRSISVGAV